MHFKIGILDFGVRNTESSTEILSDVFQSAKIADHLGFSSYWLGEHHNWSRSWSNPEMLLPILAGLTKTIRIGIAGVLLSVHSPYRVALNFKLLSNLFPNRIDLGLANGALELHIAQKMLCNKDLDLTYLSRFEPNMRELLKYLGEDSELYKSDKVIMPPVGGTIPTVWRLSLTFDGLNQCIETRMNYCRSFFQSVMRQEDENLERQRIELFRKQFCDAHNSPPSIAIAFAGLCDISSKAAQNTFENLKFPDPNSPRIIGTPSYFREKLVEWYEKYSINHFIFYSKAEDYKTRVKCLELLAREFF